MSKDINQLFQSIAELDPPKKLAGTIFKKILFQRERQLRRKLLFSRLGLAGSFCALFYTSIFFGKAIAESEFWHIASLLFTDILPITKNWQEFTYSLLETMPVINLTAILMPIFAMMLISNIYLNLRQRQF